MKIFDYTNSKHDLTDNKNNCLSLLSEIKTFLSDIEVKNIIVDKSLMISELAEAVNLLVSWLVS